MLGTLYYLEELKYKADKALIAAQFNGLSLNTSKFEEKDSKKPDFRVNPIGKVPFLETKRGCICGSAAVARYVARCRADTELYGKSFADESKIEDWLEFSLHEVEVPLMDWIYRHKGLMEKSTSAIKVAQEDVKRALAVVEKQLLQTDFLIGDFLTLADIVLVCCLREGFTASSFWTPFPNVCRWFERCCSMWQFRAVLGPVPCRAPPQVDSTPAMAAPARTEQVAPEAKHKEKAATSKAQAVARELREVKERLIRKGLSGKQINVHPEIWTLVERIKQLKAELS